MSTYNFEVPKTWTVADGQVYAILSPELTLWVMWKPEDQTGTDGFQAELYYGDQLLSTAFSTWTAQDLAEFIQLVKPADAARALAQVVEGEEEGTLTLHLEAHVAAAPGDALATPESMDRDEEMEGDPSPPCRPLFLAASEARTGQDVGMDKTSRPMDGRYAHQLNVAIPGRAASHCSYEAKSMAQGTEGAVDTAATEPLCLLRPPLLISLPRYRPHGPRCLRRIK